MKELLRKVCPPPVWRMLSAARAKMLGVPIHRPPAGEQDLSVYWEPRMAALLETWGEGTAWNEIQFLAAGLTGSVLDIACGTGKTMEILARFPAIAVHGCDISDMLLAKAVERGIARDRLTLTDATAMSYQTGAFGYGYSIGSLEHFTEDGVEKFLRECARVVRGATFHMIPVSRSDTDTGWIKTFQSYHNNSVAWWVAKCKLAYPQVQVLDSGWADGLSFGKWLICSKTP